MNIKTQDHLIDIKKIANHINIQPPYFAFNKLWKNEDTLFGSFTPEQPLINEIGPIAGGEMGRHMAILGSCAAAVLHNSPEGYYLAIKATCTRVLSQTKVSNTTEFCIAAKVINLDKRNLTASVELFGDGELITKLICKYIILSPAVFQRKFSNYKNLDISISQESPYKSPIHLDEISIQDNILNAYAGPLLPYQCSGHFDTYPCWPVAIIAQTSLHAANNFLKFFFGRDTLYCVKEMIVSADKLMSARNRLRFQIEVISNNNGIIKAITHIYDDDNEVVATITNTLEITV